MNDLSTWLVLQVPTSRGDGTRLPLKHRELARYMFEWKRAHDVHHLDPMPEPTRLRHTGSTDHSSLRGQPTRLRRQRMGVVPFAMPVASASTRLRRLAGPPRAHDDSVEAAGVVAGIGLAVCCDRCPRRRPVPHRAATSLTLAERAAVLDISLIDRGARDGGRARDRRALGWSVRRSEKFFGPQSPHEPQGAEGHESSRKIRVYSAETRPVSRTSLPEPKPPELRIQ